MIENLTFRTNICDVISNFRGSSHILGAKSNEINLCLTEKLDSLHIFWPNNMEKGVVFWLIVYSK